MTRRGEATREWGGRGERRRPRSCEQEIGGDGDRRRERGGCGEGQGGNG